MKLIELSTTLWYFRQIFVKTLSTHSAIREDLRSRLSWGGRARGLGSRLQVKHSCEDAWLWPCTQSGPALPSLASSRCRWGRIPWYQRAWVRGQKPTLRTGFVGNLFKLTDLFILSALVLSRSWEKFLPKYTLTGTSVLVLGNDAAFWSDWDCKCKYVLYLNYLLGEAFILINTFTLLTHFKLRF